MNGCRGIGNFNNIKLSSDNEKLQGMNGCSATFEKSTPMASESSALDFSATALFTENLLRSIVKLATEQQVELVTSLATNPNCCKGRRAAVVIGRT